MITGWLCSFINSHLSLLCLPQLLPSIVAPWLHKHNVQTARRSRPWVRWSRGRSGDPGSVLGSIITNRKSLRSRSHRAASFFCLLEGGWIKLSISFAAQVSQNAFCSVQQLISFIRQSDIESGDLFKMRTLIYRHWFLLNSSATQASSVPI